MKGRLRRAVDLVLRVEDTPDRIAMAFAVGVWIAFFPLVGIHTGLGLLLAFLLRLSRVAVLAGVWVNNPWTMAPMLTAGTILGCLLFGVSPQILGQVAWSPEEGLSPRLLHTLRTLLWPYVVGNLLLGTFSSVIAYFALRQFLTRRARTRGEVEADAALTREV